MNLNFLKSFYAITFMLIAIVFTGCVDEDPELGAPFLNVSTSELLFAQDGTDGNSASFKIETNRQWRATVPSGAEWVNFYPAEGEGNATIEVSVPEGINDEATILIEVLNKMGTLLSKTVSVKSGNVASREVIYNETFGSAAVASPWPLVGDYTGWGTSGTGSSAVTYSGVAASIRSSGLGSANYEGASGPNGLFFGVSANFVVNKITLTPEQNNLRLTFGASFYDGSVNTFDISKFEVALSADGVKWAIVPYTKNDGDQATPYWVFATSNFTLKEVPANLYIKFTALIASAFRLDDITLTTSNGGAEVDLDAGGTVNPGTDPNPVTSLVEDFESFTSGTGDAYFSTQANDKGWYGYKSAGTMEPDVREYTGNKYVQFSAHRNSVTESINQEFWLVSPRLDISGAASKSFSFDIAAGYYNASSVFEVYVLDSEDPNGGKTKLTGWAEPTGIPATSYTTFASSGNIDLSAYSGVKRIGFYYKGTSGTGNSTTYQVDNFVFGNASTLSVSPATLSFVQAGEAKTFTVTSNTTWNAVSSDPANFAVGISGNIVTVTAANNSTGSARSATITVTTTDGTVTKTVACSQAGAAATGNLVVNGDFSSAWTSGIPTGWTSDAASNLTITQGNGSFTVNNPTATTKLYQTIAVTPGSTYTLSFDYTATHARFRIWSGFVATATQTSGVTYLGAAADDELRTKNGYFPVAATSTPVSITFTAPAGLDYFLLEFRYYSQAGGTFELKNVRLVDNSTPPSTPANLLTNGSFENFSAAVPDGWTSGGTNTTIEKITSGAQEGSLALKMTGNTATGSLTQIVSGIEPGKKYKVSVWYKDNTKGTSSQGIRIWSNFRNSSNGNISPVPTELQPSATWDAVTTWTEYTAEVTAPADAASFLFGIRATNGQNGTYDNCSFIKVD